MLIFPGLEDREIRLGGFTLKMADHAVISDGESYKRISKDRSDLEDAVGKYRDYKRVKHNLDEARPMLNETDAELRQMAQDEVERLTPELERIEQELTLLMLPKDP